MTSTPRADVKGLIHSELTSAHSEFHALLNSFSDADWRRQSLNPGWTNGQILFHMTLGFLLIPMLVPLMRFLGRLPAVYSKAFASILNAGTGLFNPVNGFGPRVASRILNRQSLGKLFDQAYRRILRLTERIPPDEWQRGMYYPHRWDALFDEYMTVEKIFHYVVAHFNFHLAQIAR